MKIFDSYFRQSQIHPLCISYSLSNSKDSINQKIWQKMVNRGLDKSLITFKPGDVQAMVK